MVKSALYSKEHGMNNLSCRYFLQGYCGAYTTQYQLYVMVLADRHWPDCPFFPASGQAEHMDYWQCAWQHLHDSLHFRCIGVCALA